MQTQTENDITELFSIKCQKINRKRKGDKELLSLCTDIMHREIQLKRRMFLLTPAPASSLMFKLQLWRIICQNIVDRFYLRSQFLLESRQLKKAEMMLLHKVLWAFGFLSTAFTSAPKKFEIGNFGVCEHVVSWEALSLVLNLLEIFEINVSGNRC